MVGQDALAVAGINATVLAILVAVVAVFLDRERNAVRDAASRVYETADLINRLTGPPVQSVDTTLEYDATTQVGRRAMVTRLRHLGWRRMTDPSEPVPVTLDDAASEACVIMSSLVTAYPFVPRPPVVVVSPATTTPPKRWRAALASAKRVGMAVNASTRPTHGLLLFHSIDEVRQWENDLGGLIYDGGLLTQCSSRRADLESLIDAEPPPAPRPQVPEALDPAVAAQLRTEFETRDRERIAMTKQGRHAALDHFCESVGYAKTVLDAVRLELVRYTERRQRYPAAARTVPTFLGLLFLVGVVAPLLRPSTPRAIYLWLPLASYCAVVIWLAIAAARGPIE